MPDLEDEELRRLSERVAALEKRLAQRATRAHDDDVSPSL
jgi:hypothetical protein